MYSSTTSELPELPDFLKPTVKPTVRPLRPINDIDLPDGSIVIQPEEEEEPETDEDKGTPYSFSLHTKYIYIYIYYVLHMILTRIQIILNIIHSRIYAMLN